MSDTNARNILTKCENIEALAKFQTIVSNRCPKPIYSIPLPKFFNTTITMKEGIVKFFNDAKGFGFVKETATGTEYFVHISGLLVDTLKENDAVTFELKEGKKGLNAVNVRLAK